MPGNRTNDSTKEITMKVAVWSLVVLLIILHQDVWLWDDATLVGGIVPMGLFYHACISLAAGITWFLAIKFAWPVDDAAVATTHKPGKGGGA